MTGFGATTNTVDPYHDYDLGRFETASSERAPAALRTILAAHFHANRRTWGIVSLSRQRIALTAESSTVCDVCVLTSESPVERVVQLAPLICIDVISSEPLALVQNRVDAYEAIGVKHIWLLDPAFRTGWRATSSGLFQVRDDLMSVSGTSVGFRLTEIFGEMEDMIRPSRRMSVSAATERSRREARS